MTFENQVKEAKRQKLENKIVRDVIIILLGIAFLVASFMLNNKSDKKKNNKVTTKKIIEKTNK